SVLQHFLSGASTPSSARMGMPLFPHCFGFPCGPGAFVAAVLAAIEHLFSFLRIEVRNRAAETERLGLRPRVHFQIDAASHNMTDRWTDDSHAVPAHENDIFVSLPSRH